MEKLERICKGCSVVITYSRRDGFNRANRKDSPCVNSSRRLKAGASLAKLGGTTNAIRGSDTKGRLDY